VDPYIGALPFIIFSIKSSIIIERNYMPRSKCDLCNLEKYFLNVDCKARRSIVLTQRITIILNVIRCWEVRSRWIYIDEPVWRCSKAKP
jgi:hypothetical protein